MTMWKNEAEKIIEHKKSFVRDYLKANGVSPTAAGYNVLLYVILKSSEYPNYTCKDLFDAYADEVLKDNSKAASKGAYKNVNYAVKHSTSEEKSPFRFIKNCSIELE